MGPVTDDEIDQWLAQAEDMRVGGRFEAAIETLTRVLGSAPDHGPAHALLAQCLLSTRRQQAAIHEAGLALDLEPDDPMTLFSVGAVLIGVGQLQRAERVVMHLIGLEPDAGVNHALLGQICLQRRAFTEAEQHLRCARDLDPRHPSVLLISAESAFVQGGLEQARRYVTAALVFEPGDADLHTLAGRIALGQGHEADARDHALRALRAAPNDPDALAVLAGLKARQSPWLGAWWRANVWLERQSDEKLLATMLMGFVGSQLLVILADEMGLVLLASLLHWLWLCVVGYTWVGPFVFRHSLRKELERARAGMH